jgi:hypothetical protein
MLQDIPKSERLRFLPDPISKIVLQCGVHKVEFLFGLVQRNTNLQQKITKCFLPRFLPKVEFRHHVSRVVDRVKQCPMSKKDKFKL